MKGGGREEWVRVRGMGKGGVEGWVKGMGKGGVQVRKTGRM